MANVAKILPMTIIIIVNIMRLLFLFSATIFGNNLTKTLGQPREKIVPKISDHATSIAINPISSLKRKFGCKKVILK
jgi:hypothetical protein